MAEQTRVLIVDDDPLVRTGLGMILQMADDLVLVGEVDDGAGALAAVREYAPDVVLMDIRMPLKDGLAATAEIVAEPSPPAVIVLTTFDSDDMVLRALAVGASGFLLKDTPPPKMIDAIRAAAAGEPTLSPSVTEQVIRAATGAGAGARREDAVARVATLTEREREVAIAVAQGKANADIAAELFMSVATVKSYLTRIFAKLDADNRVQVAITIHDADLR